ncbi:DUF4123 domain-containing protein [Stenotrophomonas sp. Iso1]|uniref:DUF4123 domain-containing protein n=1 Tax=Stenotrophomonas sp. Iso1 TaxID=2977283 RepID=UPI0022B7C597|nr:DUF4123 domain-containing protein [Stenotrophomonas sp. Iso1]
MGAPLSSAFANNALSPAAASSLAGVISGDSVPPTWAVVDAALVDAAPFYALIERNGGSIVHGYAGSDLAAFGDAGVLLVPLVRDRVRMTAQIEKLLQLGNPTTALSWLSTSAEVPALQALCLYLGMASINDRKQPIHCRFADTRVLPELLKQLDAEQVTRVRTVVEQWAWVDRQGQYARWVPATPLIAPADSHTHLHLGMPQFRALRGNAEADGIFTLLWEQTPSLVPAAQMRGDFYFDLVRILKTATQFNVKDVKSRLQFAVLSLTSGVDFHTIPTLRTTWEGVGSGEYLLVDKMPLWGNAIWEQLEYRRPEAERGVLP